MLIINCDRKGRVKYLREKSWMNGFKKYDRPEAWEKMSERVQNKPQQSNRYT